MVRMAGLLGLWDGQNEQDGLCGKDGKMVIMVRTVKMVGWLSQLEQYSKKIDGQDVQDSLDE